jgi:hypothetical protein
VSNYWIEYAHLLLLLLKTNQKKKSLTFQWNLQQICHFHQKFVEWFGYFDIFNDEIFHHH